MSDDATAGVAGLINGALSGAAKSCMVPERDARCIVATFLNLLPMGDIWPCQPIAQQIKDVINAG